MKQNTSSDTHIHISPSALLGEDELSVSAILLDLPHLIHESQPPYRFQVRWGARRRRSAMSSSPHRPPRPPSPSPPSPSPEKTCHETEATQKVNPEVSSPATPLSFSPSESDEKPKHCRRKGPRKRTREELLEIVEGLVQRRELLRGEIETVKSYFNKLKTLNLELKAKRQELSLDITSPRLKDGEGLDYSITQPKLQPAQFLFTVHQKPSTVNQPEFVSQTSDTQQFPCGQISHPWSPGSGFDKVQHGGPPSIPDLNVSAEEAYGVASPQPLDLGIVSVDNRARAAEARRRRMMRIKEMKNSVAAVRPARCR